MSALIDNVVVTCPHCYAAVELDVDCTSGDQVYYEDCRICCAPMEVRIHVDDEGNLAYAEARHEDD